MGVLKRPPHLFSERDGGVEIPVFAFLVINETLAVFPLPVTVIFVTAVSDNVWKNSEKSQLFIIGRDALVFRVVKAAGAVVVEDVAKEIRVPVKEILFGLFIVEEFSLVGAE